MPRIRLGLPKSNKKKQPSMRAPSGFEKLVSLGQDAIESPLGKVGKKAYELFMPQTPEQEVLASINPMALGTTWLPRNIAKQRAEYIADAIGPELIDRVGRETGETFKSFASKNPGVLGHLSAVEVNDVPGVTAQMRLHPRIDEYSPIFRKLYQSRPDFASDLELTALENRNAAQELHLSPDFEYIAKHENVAPATILREEFNHLAQALKNPKDVDKFGTKIYQGPLYSLNPLEIFAKVGSKKGLGRFPKGFKQSEELLEAINAGMLDQEKAVSSFPPNMRGLERGARMRIINEDIIPRISEKLKGVSPDFELQSIRPFPSHDLSFPRYIRRK